MSKPLPGQLGFQFGGATAAKTITDNVRNGFEPTASSTIAQDPKADLIEPGVPILATIYFLGAYGQICRRGDDALFIKAWRGPYSKYDYGRAINLVASWRNDPRSKRGKYHIERTYPTSRYLLILKGDGHPSGVAGDLIGYRERAEGERFRHLAEFDRIIDQHIAATGATVLVDWRDITKDAAWIENGGRA